MLLVLYFVPVLLRQSLLVFLTVIFIVFLWNSVANYQGKACCLSVEGGRTFLCTFFRRSCYISNLESNKK